MDRTFFPTLAVMLLAASPAGAQQFAPSSQATRASLTWSKSDAILGGAPSRLAALVAQQSGATARPPITPAPLARSHSVATPQRANLSAEPAGDRPDVFGTVALPVGRTPLDTRWRKVRRQGAAGTEAAFASSLRSHDPDARIAAVNRFVNARVAFVDDSRQYRAADVWQAAKLTLRTGRGDCEDYAIAKLQLLRAAGFAERDLYLVIVRDLVRRADHAVLVVRSGDRLLMLDNGTDRIGDATEMQDYRPMLSYSAGRSWAHGYQRPNMTFAAVERFAPATPVAPAAAPVEPLETTEIEIAQRSVSASLLAFSTGLSR
ncbi:transglutaminase-like cysteine peptidase [Sphingomonas sp. GCM10030256]|uniref:transglutaminase-like cysteine peptidase n=1 Tax=Sphingomonas sp. GCM10030256 TaxID=3273427 RepID=UPI003606B93F